MNIGILMYVTNKVIGRKAFKGVFVERVEKYMKKHPDTSVRYMLELADYSGI